MSTYTDVSKARLILERRRKEYEAGRAAIEALESAMYPLAAARDEAQMKYAAALEANGQCGICEKPKGECDGHIAYAAAVGVR